jgi:hypothetical protein
MDAIPADALTGSELISELNLSRRDLEAEERAIITGKIFVMIQSERKAAAQKAAGARGGEGGRGHKKTQDPQQSLHPFLFELGRILADAKSGLPEESVT